MDDYELRLREVLYEQGYSPIVIERIIRRRVKRKRTAQSLEARRIRRRIYKMRQQEAIRNAFVSPVYLDEIFERDKAHCYLCKGDVVRTEASLDHVIPLSRGGIHDPSNVRLAHRRCNSRKGNFLLQEIPQSYFEKKRERV